MKYYKYFNPFNFNSYLQKEKPILLMKLLFWKEKLRI